MDGKALARIVAIIFVAVAVTATAVGIIRKNGPASSSPAPPMPLASSALREGLRHCQSLGEAALLISDCSRIWAEQRDRFLGVGPQSTNAPPAPAARLSRQASGQGIR
jgi:conjugative transfer region protein TrbK